MHRQAAEDLARLDQTIARLEAQTTQACADKRAADIRVRRLGELMDELRGMSAAPVAADNIRPVAEPDNRSVQRQRRWPLAVMAAIVVLAACAVLVMQSTHGGSWHSFLSHAANRIQSGSISLH
ncbi:hypothetical protein [Paraburkholderia sp. J67]|uniref:hypothetical protein n=1 Tax=Paraburkholderia sp. J67 TaxID=2805435 RepID=UPI002ABE14A5|nr:hypothetical protein [Paraburkholderia sp. J67]